MTSISSAQPAIAKRETTRQAAIARWLLLINGAASFYSAGVVLLVQVSYWLWGFVGRGEFEAYHFAWWSVQGIILVVFPVASVATVCAFAMLRWPPSDVPRWAVWLGVALQIALWVGTAIWWGRWQAELNEVHLANGTLNPLFVTLFYTHWLRVGIVTAYAILQFWMMAKSPNR